MTRTSLAVLAGVTIVLTALAVVLWTGIGGRDDRFVDRGTWLFPALASSSDGLASLTVETGNYSLALQHQDGKWRATEHGNYPVASDKVALLVSQIAGLRMWEPKTRNPELYNRVGVEEVAPGAASSRVALVGGDGATVADLVVGRSALSVGAMPSGGVFVRPSGDEQAWLAAGRVLVPQSLGEWLGTIVHVRAPDVRKIDVLSGERLVASAEKKDGQTNYELTYFDDSIVASGATAKDEGFKALTRGIVTVTAAGVVPADLVTFAADARQVVFETTTGLRLSARIGTHEDKEWVAFDASALPGASAEVSEMAERLHGYAFELESSKLSALTTPMGDLVQLPTLQPQPSPASGG